MTLDRTTHRALVEAGYAPLAEYVRKYSMTQTVSERLRRTHIGRSEFGGAFHERPVNPDGPKAADLIDELVEALNSCPVIGFTESAEDFIGRQNNWLEATWEPAIARAKGGA